MKIFDLGSDDTEIIYQVAILLFESFQAHYLMLGPTLKSALKEVEQSFQEDRIRRVAVDETRQVLGWIGGIKQYDGNVWGTSSLVVKMSFRRQGIGRLLIQDLEKRVREKGGLTLWVGTDDEDNQTTLSNTNLYHNPWEHIAKIQNLNHHPYEFYQKCGFIIVGVMPNANGIGKPDIYMAKSLI